MTEADKDLDDAKNDDVEECERFVIDAEALRDLSAVIAAQRFLDAGNCYESKGNRKKAAQYLTLAGHFFAESGDINKCADCYGKAAIRHILNDDLEAAKIIVERGIELGFDTFLFRMAKERVEATVEEEIRLELPEEEVTHPKLSISLLADSLELDPELLKIGGQEEFHSQVNLFQIDELDSLSAGPSDLLAHLKEARNSSRAKLLRSKVSNESLEPLESESPFALKTTLLTPEEQISDTEFIPISSFLAGDIQTSLATNQLESEPDQEEPLLDIESFESIQESSGGSKDTSLEAVDFSPLSKETQISSLDQEDVAQEGAAISDIKISSVVASGDSSKIDAVVPLSEPETIEIPVIDIEQAPTDIQEVLKNIIHEDEEFYADGSPTASGLNYLSTSTFENKKGVPIKNAELLDIIPFEWQVISVSAPGLKLISRETIEDQGVLYRWQKPLLEPNEKVQVKYILRRRIERSILSRKGRKVALITTYHNIDWSNPDKFKTVTYFANTASESFDEVFIEDIIPPEVIVVSSSTISSLSSMRFPTENSTAYRWSKTPFEKSEEIEITYRFRKKQSSRWFTRFITLPNQNSLRIEKIAQPMLVEGIGEVYYILYRISSTRAIKLQLQDKIPADFNVHTVFPSWIRPQTVIYSGWSILSWSIELDPGVELTFLIHIEGPKVFFPTEPVLKIKNLKIDSREIKKKKELVKIDFRQYFPNIRGTAGRVK
ncbi:MAG: hypothetical protein ACFFCZ_00800 [Promethearchaeota archaeon]